MFNEIESKSDRNEKIQLLRKYNCQALREVLRYALIPSLKFYTQTVPKYKMDNAPEGMSFNSLYNESRRFYILTSPETEKALSGKNTSLKRKQEILVQILENIHPGESALLESMIRGDFSKKYGMSKKLVEEALPQIFK